MIEKSYIPVVTSAECRKVYLEEVLYIEYTYRKVTIHTLRNRYSFYDKIENVEKYLDERFCHCLKYLIVNYDMVISMKSGVIQLVGGGHIEIGQQNFIKAKQRYAYYIINRQDILKNKNRQLNMKVSENPKQFNCKKEEF